MAGARSNFGGRGATLTNLARHLELPVVRNMETASRFERVQSTAWAQLARDRGNLQPTKDEMVAINRDRLHQCVADQPPESSLIGEERKRPRSPVQHTTEMSRRSAPGVAIGRGAPHELRSVDRNSTPLAVCKQVETFSKRTRRKSQVRPKGKANEIWVAKKVSDSEFHVSPLGRRAG